MKGKIFYWAPYMGFVGTVRAVINSAKAMKKYGNYEVSLIKTYKEWEGFEEELQKEDINIIDFKIIKKIFSNLPKYNIGFRISMIIISLFSIPKLIKLINKEKPDIFIVNLLTTPALFAIKCSFHKPFTIVSIQGFPRLTWWRKFLWKKMYKQVDLVWALSEETANMLKKQLKVPKDKLVVIPNPVIDEEIKNKAQEPVEHKWFRNKDKPIVIGVGRLTKQKDFETLIKAFALVKKKVDARLVILGEGEERPKLEKLVKNLGLQEDVWMPGFVKNPYKFIAKSDVFVLSSLWEDPGHVIIEAAYLKIPIVATNCPVGPKEFLENGKGGFLCEIKDFQCISKQIVYVLHNKKNQEVLKRIERAYRNSLKFTISMHCKFLSRAIKEIK